MALNKINPAVCSRLAFCSEITTAIVAQPAFGGISVRLPRRARPGPNPKASPPEIWMADASPVTADGHNRLRPVYALFMQKALTFVSDANRHAVLYAISRSHVFCRLGGIGCRRDYQLC